MAPKLKYQSGNGYRLDRQEREFAEKNHNLLLKFLGQNKLPMEEYYDVAAVGYTIAVMKYHRQEKLRKYKFSTIAYKGMRTSVSNEMESQRRYQEHIECSMDQDMGNGDSYGEYVPDHTDHFGQIEQQEEMGGLIRQVMTVLTRPQREILAMKLEGYKMNEIMKKQHRSFVDYFRDEEEIKKAVLSVTCGCGIAL